MNTFKRMRTINLYNEDTKATNTIKVIAESEKAYKTSDNKIVKKADIEKKQIKNTIDYRFNTTDEDVKYNKIQEKLASKLELDSNTDMRVVKELFSIAELTRSVAITTTDSTILNRASCFEIMLSEHDYLAIKDVFECEVIAFDEKKYKNIIKTSDSYTRIYSCKLASKADIEKFNQLTR